MRRQNAGGLQQGKGQQPGAFHVRAAGFQWEYRAAPLPSQRRGQRRFAQGFGFQEQAAQPCSGLRALPLEGFLQLGAGNQAAGH